MRIPRGARLCRDGHIDFPKIMAAMLDSKRNGGISPAMFAQLTARSLDIS